MSPELSFVNCYRLSRNRAAFTVLEVLVVVVIVAIIASMLLPVYSNYTSRMEEARCLANLRNLYVAASGYLLANESWPQIPVQLLVDQPKAYARAWVSALAPFGAPHSTWICPTIQRSFQISMDELAKDENYRIDFIATPFDDQPSSPRRSATHPWFIEKSGIHSRGNLVVLANGSTLSLRDLAGGDFGK
jgi:prepilin-type N-terminal cleavage/methylation domain-containing protein